MQKSYFSPQKIVQYSFLTKGLAKMIAIIAVFATVSGFSLQAQTKQVSGVIVSALTKGDAEKLSTFFANSIELVVDNNDDVYSKAQATSILNDFFNKNKVISFQVLHNGTKDSASFLIGLLRTSNNQEFRVYVLTRGEQSQIQQLRIEPSND